jgi:hypothetical protein
VINSSIDCCPECGGAILKGVTSWGGPICHCVRPSRKAPDDLHSWMRIQEEINRYLLNEIAKLKEDKTLGETIRLTPIASSRPVNTNN